MTRRLALALVLVLALPAIASADAIGGPCPSGQIYQAHPTRPGAMHHAGGGCVPDPAAASHCSAHPGRSSSGAPFVLAFALAWLGRNRRRDKVRGA